MVQVSRQAAASAAGESVGRQSTLRRILARAIGTRSAGLLVSGPIHQDGRRALSVPARRATGWERVTRRAGLPLAYSRGFSPKPRLSFGPPLPVGAEGRREYMTMALRDPLHASQVQARLAAAAIPGMAVVEVAHSPGRRVRTTWADYEFTITPPPRDLADRVERLMSRDEVEIERARDPEGVKRDIRPGMVNASSENGRILHGFDSPRTRSSPRATSPSPWKSNPPQPSALTLSSSPSA